LTGRISARDLSKLNLPEPEETRLRGQAGRLDSSVKGTLELTKAATIELLSENHSTYIPLSEKHRLGVRDRGPIRSYRDEDGIVRFRMVAAERVIDSATDREPWLLFQREVTVAFSSPMSLPSVLQQ
jgi:hypothetical protein